MSDQMQRSQPEQLSAPVPVSGCLVRAIKEDGAFGRLGVRVGDLLVSVFGVSAKEWSRQPYEAQSPSENGSLQAHYVRDGVLILAKGKNHNMWSLNLGEEQTRVVSAVLTDEFYSPLQVALLTAMAQVRGTSEQATAAARKRAILSFAAGAALTGAGVYVRQRMATAKPSGATP